jgi:hypothetical protein
MTSGSTGVAAPVLSLGAIHAQIRGGVADADSVTVSARHAAKQRMHTIYEQNGEFQSDCAQLLLRCTRCEPAPKGQVDRAPLARHGLR